MIEVTTSMDALPNDLQIALAQLDQLEDVAVWQAARSRMAPEAAERLQELNAKRQRQGLEPGEMQEKEALIRQYEWAMLVRAKAAAVLKQRGHDVSSLLSKPSSGQE